MCVCVGLLQYYSKEIRLLQSFMCGGKSCVRIQLVRVIFFLQTLFKLCIFSSLKDEALHINVNEECSIEREHGRNA